MHSTPNRLYGNSSPEGPLSNHGRGIDGMILGYEKINFEKIDVGIFGQMRLSTHILLYTYADTEGSIFNRGIIVQL